jgi:glutathione S-transferase
MDAVGLDYEIKSMDLAKGEQKTPEFLKVNPIGKVPALQHGDFCLFESGAICRYVANVENSSLYPKEPFLRAQVDQWLDFFSAHVGRWLSALFYENVIKSRMGRGSADQTRCEEALGFLKQQLPPVETHLAKTGYFAGNQLSIADLAAFAYIDQAGALQYDLSPYPNLKAWHEKMAKLESVRKTKSRWKL